MFVICVADSVTDCLVYSRSARECITQGPAIPLSSQQIQGQRQTDYIGKV